MFANPSGFAARLLSACAALALLLAATPLATTGAVAEEPKSGGTLVYGVESEIPWYDPHVVFGGSNKRVVLQIFEGLVDRDRTQPGVVPPLVPRLAESWEVSDDGTVYRFHLRKGVSFHDGTPFDADAVVFNVRRVIDPEFEHYKEGTDPLRSGPVSLSHGGAGRRRAHRRTGPRPPLGPFHRPAFHHAAQRVAPDDEPRLGRGVGKTRM